MRPFEVDIAGLFEGMGGLTMAVQQVLGGRLGWYSEYEPPTEKNPRPTNAAAKLLAYHYPDAPNLGDVTGIDWEIAPRPRILTGGFPCQDVSAAGKRAGLNPNSRSGLWVHMAKGIDVLRPELVIIENVRGLLSATADSAMEPCPWCLGNGPDSGLRALGAVLGDLVDLGYDARWCGLPAAGVDAPHERFRVFILAWPAADTDGGGRERASHEGWGPVLGATAAGGGDEPDGGPVAADADGVGPVRGGGARGRRGGPADDGVAAADADGAGRDAGEGLHRAGGAAVVGDGAPAAADADDGADFGEWARAEPRGGGEGGLDWGIYGDAIRRWERALGRVAPAPTQRGQRGGQQLSPLFVEWMQGLPEGHVTDVPGLTRNDQLKILGNGVVPAQAAEALRFLLEPV